MEKIEKLTLENFKQGNYGVYINNVLLIMEIKDIDYEEGVKLALWLPNGGEIAIVGSAWELEEDIEDEDFGGIVEDELHFKDIHDNKVIITNNPNKF
jgi:hypothetical protein